MRDPEEKDLFHLKGHLVPGKEEDHKINNNKFQEVLLLLLLRETEILDWIKRRVKEQD